MRVFGKSLGIERWLLICRLDVWIINRYAFLLGKGNCGFEFWQGCRKAADLTWLRRYPFFSHYYTGCGDYTNSPFLQLDHFYC